MGGVIAIADSPDSIWLKANWVYFRLLADTSATAANDADVVKEIENARVFQCLSLDKLETGIANRIVAALKAVALATVNDDPLPGLRWKEGLDDNSTGMYREAVRELLELLERYGENLPPGVRGTE